MGEFSKKVGEKGERIVKFVFEEILGFNSLIENEFIGCNKGKKHKLKSSKGDRTSHGVDGLIFYESPLEDYTLDIGVISSKYKGDLYPSNPINLFKEHLKDLAYTIECFNNSKLKNDINRQHYDINKTEIFGILVWLANGSEIDYDLISKVEKVQIDNSLIFDRIILLDNRKINYLYDSIYNTRAIFGSNNIDYVYHETGLNNITRFKMTYGKLFPLNYLYSDLILLRVQNGGNVELHVFIDDEFQQEQFLQILNFIKTFDDLSAVNKTILNFRKYNNLLDDNYVKEKLIRISNYKLNFNIEIKKFPSDFKNN